VVGGEGFRGVGGGGFYVGGVFLELVIHAIIVPC
jgi:hypothetical protein